MSVESAAAGASPPPADESPQGQQHNLGLALMLISAAQLMVVLDATVVNIALPHIKAELGFSASNLTWVVTSYSIAFGGLLLLGGRMGDILGRRKVFMAGVLIFALASLFGGLAQSEWQILSARALQGLGAAAASPTALALITTTFPAGPPRNRAFAVYAAMSGAGAAVGLIVGGALTEASWRWTMLINVPIGVLAAALAPRLLNESEPRPGRFDVAGAVTATLGLVGIVYGFNHKAQTIPGTTPPQPYAWTDSWTVGPIVAGVVLLTSFFVIEARSRHPLLPMRIIRDRTRGISFVSMLLIGTALFAMFLFLSLYIQDVLGYSPIRAGLAFLPFSFAIVASAQLASALASRVDPRWIAGGGGSLAALGMWGFSRLEYDSSYWVHLLPWILVMAAGMGLVFVPLTLTALSRVDAADSGVGSAVLNTVQQIGGAVGIALLGTVYANGISDKFTQLRAAGTGAPPSREQMQTSSLIAQTYGSTQAFTVAILIVAASAVITLILLDIKHERLATDGAPGAPG